MSRALKIHGMSLKSDFQLTLIVTFIADHFALFYVLFKKK